MDRVCQARSNICLITECEYANMQVRMCACASSGSSASMRMKVRCAREVMRRLEEAGGCQADGYTRLVHAGWRTEVKNKRVK